MHLDGKVGGNAGNHGEISICSQNSPKFMGMCVAQPLIAKNHKECTIEGRVSGFLILAMKEPYTAAEAFLSTGVV